MSGATTRPADHVPIAPPPAPRTILLTGLAIAAGALVAAFVLPAWLPGLSGSLLGPQPKAYWYLSRASGLAAFGLVWLSMIWGVLLTSRAARTWPGVASAADLHQHVSLLGLGFCLFHGLILLGDRFAKYRLSQILVPFTTTEYRPLWVGIGQVGFYALAIIALSFYLRPWLSNRAWGTIHLLSYGVYLSALAHGVMSGTDSGVPWISAFYLSSAGLLLFLIIYRILVSRFSRSRIAPRTTTTA